ncbi:transposase [Streptomyces sp. NPDC001315]|uniref:transposase n=1 Tax=Streptomyces sp. NPDC001315 TaxID=3364562 RepID=UPI0036A5BD82
MSLPVGVPGIEALGLLSRFRVEFYECLYKRADALFELTDAVLCTDGPVKTLVELSLAVEHRRGHGALYAALDRGWLEPTRLRRTLAGLPLPKAADGRIVLAVDVSHWLRPDAPTSGDRLFCHVYGRGDRNSDQLVPGWPYSFVAALESGRTSWVALLDAVRLGPADDATTVTAVQLHDVVRRLTSAGHWRPGDPDMLIVMDPGYDVAYLTHALANLPVVLVGRLRSEPGHAPRPRPRAVGSPGRAPPPAWRRPHVQEARQLARTRRHDRHGHHPLRHSHRDGLGPDAPPAHSPRPLAGARQGRTPHPAWHVDPPEGRAPAR